MRDRALQLLNVKLLHQGIPESDAERGEKEGINMYLSKFAKKLNQWVKPAESKEEVTVRGKTSRLPNFFRYCCARTRRSV